MFKTAKGRGYLEAFMGGEMEDSAVDELIDNGFREGVMGKTALASFEVKFTADGNEQLKVVLLRPDKASGRSKSGTGAAAAPARPVAPPSRTEAEVEADTEPAPAPVASTPSGSRRRAAAADNDLPF